jgi:hypothetical protein
MKFKSQELLNQLIVETKSISDYAEQLKSYPIEQLNHRTSKDSWSVLECLEHLNLYGRFYIPEIRSAISNSSRSANELFKSGWLGNYFAKSMLPKQKLNKMKTFKEMNPIHSNLNVEVIDDFLSQQVEMLHLLERAKSVNLSKTKTNISISKLIKMRLGDTFRFVIYHNLRHIEQARKVINYQL